MQQPIRAECIQHPGSFAIILLSFFLSLTPREILTGPKIPCLDNDRITSLLQNPSDPLGPLLIGFIVANEKMFHLVCPSSVNRQLPWQHVIDFL
jgi:hypothetical protein